MRHLKWKKFRLNFRRPGGTSRGVMYSRDTWLIELEENGKTGWGECGMLKGLSADDQPDFESKLDWLEQNINRDAGELHEKLIEFPSIQFGLEQALLDIRSDQHILFPSDFTRGEDKQAINGLIWMGEPSYMKKQVYELLEKGFQVLKLKIGAIDLKEELEILKMLRKEYSQESLQLRVDANGAFSPAKAAEILNHLAELEVHSIEQPIKAGQWQEMAALCENPPLPVALDEELIGLFTTEDRHKMLHTIKPQYLILKPSFIGGFKGAEEWIKMSSELDVKWWVTSALESNVGLNAIAQWNYIQDNDIASGLGTGSLFTNNFRSPLYVNEGGIGYDPQKGWQKEIL